MVQTKSWWPKETPENNLLTLNSVSLVHWKTKWRKQVSFSFDGYIYQTEKDRIPQITYRSLNYIKYILCVCSGISMSVWFVVMHHMHKISNALYALVECLLIHALNPPTSLLDAFFYIYRIIERLLWRVSWIDLELDSDPVLFLFGFNNVKVG